VLLNTDTETDTNDQTNCTQTRLQTVDEFMTHNVSFIQSDGRLVKEHEFNGPRALLSGPAGGYIGMVECLQSDVCQDNGAE